MVGCIAGVADRIPLKKTELCSYVTQISNEVCGVVEETVLVMCFTYRPWKYAFNPFVDAVTKLVAEAGEQHMCKWEGERVFVLAYSDFSEASTSKMFEWFLGKVDAAYQTEMERHSMSVSVPTHPTWIRPAPRDVSGAYKGRQALDRHVFVDLSNVLHRFQDRDALGSVNNDFRNPFGGKDEFGCRLDVQKLLGRIRLGRLDTSWKGADAFSAFFACAGKYEHMGPQESAWGKWANYVISQLQRTWKHAVYPRGKEFGVDATIVAQIYEALSSTASVSVGVPRVLVLVSGDGNANMGNASILKACRDAVYVHGWYLELWSWNNSVSPNYATIADEMPHLVRRYSLDWAMTELLAEA